MGRYRSIRKDARRKRNTIRKRFKKYGADVYFPKNWYPEPVNQPGDMLTHFWRNV